MLSAVSCHNIAVTKHLRHACCRYPTFTRMEPPDTQVTTSVLALLKYHKWFKFTIVSQKNEQWRTIAEDLRMQAEMRPEFTVRNLK